MTGICSYTLYIKTRFEILKKIRDEMDFRDLDALHAAHDLLIEIHDISQSFPADDQFTLGDAICFTAARSCLSLGDESCLTVVYLWM